MCLENAPFGNSVYDFVRMSKNSLMKKFCLGDGGEKKFERRGWKSYGVKDKLASMRTKNYMEEKPKEEEKPNPLDEKNTIETIVSNRPESKMELCDKKNVGEDDKIKKVWLVLEVPK